MKKQSTLYKIGLFFLVVAMFVITALPIILQKFYKIYLNNSFYSQVEAFFLVLSAIFFMLSPKYRNHQLFCVLLMLLLYILFTKTYFLFA